MGTIHYVVAELEQSVDLRGLGGVLQALLLENATTLGAQAAFFLYLPNSRYLAEGMKMPGVQGHDGFAFGSCRTDAEFFAAAFAEFWQQSFNDYVGLIVRDGVFGPDDVTSIEEAIQLTDAPGCLLPFFRQLSHPLLWPGSSAATVALLDLGSLVVLKGYDNQWLCFITSPPTPEKACPVIQAMAGHGLEFTWGTTEARLKTDLPSYLP